MKLSQLVTELRSRGVYRVAAVYSAAAWALLQTTDVIAPLLGLPDWSVSAVLATAAAGFPIAIALSWFFDLTSEGLVEAPPISETISRSKISFAHVVQLGLIFLLTILVGELYLERLGQQPDTGQLLTSTAEAQRPSIAVMPFVNMSQDVDMEYFGDGLAEEILNLLAKLNELDVAARTSSFYFKDRPEDIRNIGEQLGVAHVLEGSVRHDGTRVRVTAQLIDINNGYHLWSETYDRELDNILSIQDEIAEQVVSALKILLSKESREILAHSTNINPASFDYYLQGRARLREPPDLDSLELARDFFDKSLAADPEFADAYAGLCESLLGLYSIDLDTEKFRQAEDACQSALRLDRRAGSVYIALGNLYTASGQYEQAIEEFETAISIGGGSADAYLGLGVAYFEHNQPKLAEQSYTKSIELQPNYWQAYMSMGNFLFDTGQLEEAIPYFQRVTELMPQSEMALNNLGAVLFFSGDFSAASQYWRESLELAPSSEAFSNVATSLYFSKRYNEAVDFYHKAVEFAPDDCALWGNLGDAYSQLPDSEELAKPMYRNAIKLALERLQINSSDSETLALMGHYQAMLGERDIALEYIDRAVKQAPGSMIVNFNAATALANLGESERSLDMLEKALSLGYPWVLASADGNLEPLKNSPRYAALGDET